MSRPRLAGAQQLGPAQINRTVLDVQSRDVVHALAEAESAIEQLRARDRARAERASDPHQRMATKYGM